MNNPAPTPEPPKPVPAVTPAVIPAVPPAVTPAVAAVVNPKLKIARGAEKQHNRQVGHMLKSASLHRHMPVRSVPHSRGR